MPDSYALIHSLFLGQRKNYEVGDLTVRNEEISYSLKTGEKKKNRNYNLIPNILLFPKQVTFKNISSGVEEMGQWLRELAMKA